MEIKTEFFLDLPDGLRNELIRTFNEVLVNYSQKKWEPTELNAGKFCEVVYTIIKGYVDGSYPLKPQKPSNMVDACRRFEQLSSLSIPRSIRIQIPRILIALYEIRNNRNVGHVGGDVDPNTMDATVVLYMTKWIIAELIRIFHAVDIETATLKIKHIVERVNPFIWLIDDNYRILDNSLSMKEKALLLLYHQNKKVHESDLVKWLEHSNVSVFRRDILKKAHKTRLIEFNNTNRTTEISPLGIKQVEEVILPKIS